MLNAQLTVSNYCDIYCLVCEKIVMKQLHTLFIRLFVVAISVAVAVDVAVACCCRSFIIMYFIVKDKLKTRLTISQRVCLIGVLRECIKTHTGTRA